MEKLQSSSAPWVAEASSDAISLLFSGNWSLEKVAIALKIQPHYPNADWTILSSRFKGSDMLSSKNVNALVSILKVRSVS